MKLLHEKEFFLSFERIHWLDLVAFFFVVYKIKFRLLETIGHVQTVISWHNLYVLFLFFCGFSLLLCFCWQKVKTRTRINWKCERILNFNAINLNLIWISVDNCFVPPRHSARFALFTIFRHWIFLAVLLLRVWIRRFVDIMPVGIWNKIFLLLVYLPVDVWVRTHFYCCHYDLMINILQMKANKFHALHYGMRSR